jgi:predicted ATPase
MNIRLSGFSVSNYRSCIRTRFIPHPQLSCLIGYNGSGKSNILSAILLLRSLQQSHVFYRKRESTQSRCRINAVFAYGRKTIRLRTGLLFSPDESGSEDLTPYRTEWNFSDFDGTHAWLELPLGEPGLFYQSEFRLVRTTRVRVGRRTRWRENRAFVHTSDSASDFSSP